MAHQIRVDLIWIQLPRSRLGRKPFDDGADGAVFAGVLAVMPGRAAGPRPELAPAVEPTALVRVLGIWEKVTIGPFQQVLRPCHSAAAWQMLWQPPRSAARSPVQWAAFVVTFNGAEMMAMRSEDRDARQRQQAFADGATVAELEKHLAFLRSLGAPGDAHPRVGVNDDYEITWMTCVVQRRTLDSSRQ